MKANELKPGKAIVIDGNIWMCVKTEHVKPGKGGAFVQAKLKSIQGNGTNEKRFRSTDDIEQAILDRRDVEYLYTDGTGAVFMDVESYDQFNIDADVLGDSLKYLKPNEQIKGLFNDGNCLAVELPAAVEMIIKETEPGIKNATATNVMKEAITETGLKIRVPPFINAGEKVSCRRSNCSKAGRRWSATCPCPGSPRARR
jgi:elongation factor P